MRCLIRNVTRRGRDGLVHQDKEVVADRITIGRKPDSHVYLSDLRVAHEHAKLTQTGAGSFLVVASAPSGVRIEHEVRASSMVAPGHRIGIGNFELSLVEPPPGFDLQLDVEQVRTERGKELEAALRARSVLRLADTGLGRRPWAWGLFLIVLIAFGVLPVAGFYAEPLRNFLRSAPLPGDGAWNPGPLATAHRTMGEDCNACHQQPFVQVPDSACIACHERTPHHVDPASQGAHAVTAIRCAQCHRDHKGDDVFTRSDEGLCADCHRELDAIEPGTTFANVSGFGADHPQFRASMLVGEGLETRIERRALDQGDGLVEHSNLRFPHDVHLAAEGLENDAGDTRVLACIDCHVPETGGLRMAPVRYEAHCQDCHRLRFAVEDPQRELIHGEPDAVYPTIEEFYAMRALAGGHESEDAPEVVRRLRRPGEQLTPAEREEAMAWVRRTAVTVATEMFEFSTCATCHTVTPVALRDGDARASWQLAPVRVATQWLPKARFSHRRHSTMDCAHCHDAQASSASEDVLIKGIESCRECHGGARERDKLASTCVDCHDFHNLGDFITSPATSWSVQPQAVGR